jgi:hypothetical protein
MWIERGARVGLIASSRSIEINSFCTPNNQQYTYYDHYRLL